MNLVAEPFIPFALWLAIALLAVAVLVWYGLTNKMAATRSQKMLILGLMATTLALPLIILLNLTWIQNVPPPAGKPVVRIVIDTSASMATEDASGQSRLSEACQIAQLATAALQDQFDVRISSFDRILKTSDLETLEQHSADSNETNLASAITDSIKEDIPQGQSILLLSDGIHNASAVSEVIASATKAQAMDIPIFAATLGGDVGVKNLAVSLRSPQELAFVGQTVPTVVSVSSIGLGNVRARIELWSEGEKLEQQEVDLKDGSGDATFGISQEQPGLYRYEVRAGEVSGEATLADNRSTLMFRVVDRPIKILLVEGKPYWDTKFLVRRLAADQSVELTSVIRMAENRYLKRTVARSGVNASGSLDKATEASEIIHDGDQVLSAASLEEVQIVVLGRNAEYFLSDESLDALRNWISQEGGSLVCARGAPSAQVTQRLSQILPVTWAMGRESRFRVAMTTQGRDLRWLASFGDDDVLGTMPSLSSVAAPTQRDGLANVLAATVDRSGEQVIPVLSYQPYGSGRTVVIEGAGMWRWALMAPEHSEQEKVYGTLWRSLLRWLVSRAGLMPGQNISLQPDRVRFDVGDTVTATMLVRQEKINRVPKVRVQSTGDPRFSQDFSARPVGQNPGVYRFDFGQLPPGQYTVETIGTEASLGDASPSSAKSAFDVQERWVEKLELDARPDVMARIAEVSGGSVLVDNDPAEFAKQFRDHLANSHPPQFRRVPVWDRWWIMGALLALWTTTWIVRRRSGLV